MSPNSVQWPLGRFGPAARCGSVTQNEWVPVAVRFRRPSTPPTLAPPRRPDWPDERCAAGSAAPHQEPAPEGTTALQRGAHHAPDPHTDHHAPHVNGHVGHRPLVTAVHTPGSCSTTGAGSRATPPAQRSAHPPSTTSSTTSGTTPRRPRPQPLRHHTRGRQRHSRLPITTGPEEEPNV